MSTANTVSLTLDAIRDMSQRERESLYVSKVQEKLDSEVEFFYENFISEDFYKSVQLFLNELMGKKKTKELKAEAIELASKEWKKGIESKYEGASGEIKKKVKIELIKKKYQELYNSIEERAEYVLKQCILLIGNPMNDANTVRINNMRRVDAQGVMKALAKRIQSRFKMNELQLSMEISVKLISLLDRLMFRAEREIFVDEEGSEYTSTVLLCSWKLDTNETDLPALDKFPLPIMNSPTKDWKSGIDGGGYLTDMSKITLKKGEAYQPQNVLDVINKLQSQEFSIEDRYNPYEHEEYLVKKFTKKYDEELSKKMAKTIVMSQLDSFEIAKGQTLRFQWKADFRGRMYNIGYGIHLQGDSFAKGLTLPTRRESKGAREFDREEKHLYWRAVHIANLYGLDKEPFEKRVDWVEQNLQALEKYIPEADSVKEYKTAVEELRRELAGIENSSMVYLDASNQALQIYSVLLSCSKTASTCNLNNGTERADAYKMLANSLNEEFGVDIFNRTNCKKALMTTMYSKIRGWTKIPKKMFEGQRLSSTEAEQKLLETLNVDSETMQLRFWKALKNIAPEAVKAMNALQELNTGKDVYYWTIEDGFIVKYDVKQEQSYEYETINKYGIKFEAKGFADVYKGSKESRGMSPNVIHSVDGWVAREMIRRMNGKFITTIHDAFGCYPEDAELMYRNYQDIMVELNEKDMLRGIMSQIAGYRVPSLKVNTLTEKMIRGSVNMLG